jgi:hypothetical protein
MWLLDTDFTDFQIKFERVLKKLTHGRRFWHGLHGLKIKVLKISPVWSFTSNIEHIFSDMYVAFWHGLHGLPYKV